jgi:hypothetical protein
MAPGISVSGAGWLASSKVPSFTPGRPSDRRDHVLNKINVKGEQSESRVTVPQALPLRVILLKTGAPGG